MIAALRLHAAGMMLPAVYFATAVFIPLLFICYRIIPASNKSDFHLISNLLKLLMLAGVLGLQPLAMSL